MAQSLEHLTRQQRTLSSIRGIVRTMKTLAAINVAPYERAAEGIETYQRTIRKGFAAFAFRMGAQGLNALPRADRHVLVVFGSDHGFCGNYNDLVAQAAAEALRHLPASPQPLLICVGARMQDALADMGIRVDERFNSPASVDGIARLAGQLVTHIEQSSQGLSLAGLGVQLVYTRRAEHGTRTTQHDVLLPVPEKLLEPPARWPSRALPNFSMEPVPMLSALLRNHIFAGMFRAAAEAMVTENSARLALMQQAEQSVDERLDLLRSQLSSLRQDEITEELMDIIAGHIA